MQSLVENAQKGNKDAFVELMENHKQVMYKIAKSYLSSDADVADAMQETVLACYEHLVDLRETRYFKTSMTLHNLN